jgi:hypothetical protein
MNSENIFKDIILNDSKMQMHFFSYVFDKLSTEEGFFINKILEKFFIEYNETNKMSLSKLYKLLQNVDDEILNDIMLFKDYPIMKNFISSIPKKLDDRKLFTFLEGLETLANYGLNKSIGINDKHKFYMATLKAQKQSLLFNKKDLNGLLGVTGLFKRASKKTNYKPHSIWTVKNR